MTDYTIEIKKIKLARSLDEIQDIARQFPAKTSGEGGILYSRPVGNVSSEAIALELAEKTGLAEHFLPTGVQDGFVDAIMVRDKANLQEQAVRAFTQKVLDEAEQQGIAKTM